MQPRTPSRGLAAVAEILGALAPTATVAPGSSSPNSPQVQTPRAQNQNAQGMTQAQAVRANQALGIHGGFHGWSGPSNTSILTFPAWNQRKARRTSRQTGGKIQKRYAR